LPENTVARHDGLLETNLTDDALGYIRNQKSVNPDKPFFLYYAAPSTHAPLQAPADWIARFAGKFDGGWDSLRNSIAARQKAMGIIPRSARLAPMHDGVPAWASLTADQKRYAARWMEVYAGMLAYEDAQFGRMIDELERIGQLDNTIVIFLEGDNGSALEGSALGKINPMGGFANAVVEDEAYSMAMLDKLGGPEAVGNYGYGWAIALDSPNRYAKQYASHLGGVRNGMVISWPERITARGIRSQFAHVNDVMPTILELVGIEPPASVNGVEQQPIDGVSFAYSFDAPAAPERHDTQYFEMMGNRAIYHRGWWAGTTPVRLPWGSINTSGIDPTRYEWELYDLRSDPAQAINLAAKMPEKLAEMQTMFDREAKANQVYPLDDRLTIARFMAAAPHPRAQYTYWGNGVSVPAVSAAPLLGLSFNIRAQLDLPSEPASGTVLALGSKFAGWSFALVDGVPQAVMAASQVPGDQSVVRANRSLPPGKASLEFEFARDAGRNAGGELTIRANGEEIGHGRVDRTISKLVEQTDTLDVGFDADTPVVDGPASRPFNGMIERVDVMPVLAR
jgi:arylsulfatase